MFRFLHLADLHLGWEPAYLDSKKAKERRKRRDSLLERAADFSLDEGIDLVVIAGDLFETHRPDSALVQHVLSQLNRLTEAGVQVVTTPGNHDEITYANSVYREYEEEWPGTLITNPLPRHVTTLELGSESVHVYSLAYTGGVTPVQRPLSDFPLLAEPGFHLAVFHGTAGSGGERSLPLDRGALTRAGYDYVALGHIHIAHEMDLGGSKVVYSGCQEGKGFDDVGVPHWTVVSAGAGGCEIERPPLAVQRIHVEELDLTECESVQEIEELIGELADGDALVRLRLVGSLHFELDAQDLQARFARHFYHFDVRDDSDSVGAQLLDEWAAEKTVRGAFVRQIRERMDQAPSVEERRKLVRALRYGIHALRAA